MTVKKIALISHSGYFSGAEKMLFLLGKLLQQDSLYYPIIFFPEGQEKLPLQEMCDRENIEYTKIDQLPLYIYVTNLNFSTFSECTVQSVKKLANEFRYQNISLVLCNTLTSLVPVLAAREAGIPVIVWIHGILDDFFIPQDYDASQRLLFDRILINLSNAVVCCSEWTKIYYQYLSEKSIHVIPNWIENPNHSVAYKATNIFTCLNTFDPNKNIKILLEAALLLKKKTNKFSINLYGTGSEEKQLKQFVYDNQLEKNVFFLGRTIDVDTVYQKSCCLLQPSLMESFGLTVVEAMSHARPVIATNTSNISNLVVDGENGYLISATDPEKWAEKMYFIIEHPDEAKNMGLTGQKLYQKYYTPQQAKKAFCLLIDQIISKNNQTQANEILLEDFLLFYLQAQEKRTFAKQRTAAKLGISTPVLQPSPEQLCFSGPIKKRRSYQVKYNGDKFEKIALIFNSLDKSKGHGMLYVKIMQKEILIAEGRLPIDNIHYDSWEWITLNFKSEFHQGWLTIQLLFVYEKRSAILGVFEYAIKQKIIHKILHKLNFLSTKKDTIAINFK